MILDMKEIENLFNKHSDETEEEGEEVEEKQVDVFLDATDFETDAVDPEEPCCCDV